MAVAVAVRAGLERGETPDSLRRLSPAPAFDFLPTVQLRYASGVLRAAAGNHERLGPSTTLPRAIFESPAAPRA
ncbi:MAG TPA: hypothetical protein VK304_04075 [Thermoleophilaceae bacterium]|nr:hypothetical protein [Thermoleophilaceae bacterium]